MKEKNRPKIYRMNEFDTVIAYSKKEAVDWYTQEYFSKGDYESIKEECHREKDLSKGYWYNLPPASKVRHQRSRSRHNFPHRHLSVTEELRVSTWGGDPAYWVTFKYVLENLLDNLDIPGIICTTEW